MTKRHGLSKSRITLFEQCPRRLWLSVHRPEAAVVAASTRSAFADGHRVGELACRLHPGGFMIDDARGLGAAIDETARLLASTDRPLFEATFAHEGVLVRVDLMLPTASGWHVAEVKNTTGMKEYHRGDLATQLWVMRGAGVNVARASIRHIDRSFVLSRAGDYAGLFADSFIGADLEPVIAGRGVIVAAARAVLASDEPAREIGAHCDTPFACSFKSWCGRGMPAAPMWPVSLLPDTAGKKLAAKLIAGGISDLTLAPAEAMTSAKLSRVHAATVSGVPFHDAEAIVAETDDWAYPRTYLDFETIQFAIPRWLGTKPFEQVPFQWSAHVAAADGSIAHHEFLSINGIDPRRLCAEALITLPATGAVIAWNAPFERTCLIGLARLFPDLAASLTSLADRLVDLLPVARRHYYHRDMHGSWSIKAVLPTLGTPGYDELTEVKSGTDAQAGYLEAIDPATSDDRREALRQGLLAYCARDTEAMLVVLDRLTRAPDADGNANA
ncbi:DUF2779 domain-containing protein [Sphingomonas bacterium]|uniref:DUF2779 domain-containing protein n=1 Tax=Sphingomonas bacterium TaxID=1895847 RepID=UPI0015758E85|nr:DUF2779 domain-containing protein [Sphingomonas bacterium]